MFRFLRWSSALASAGLLAGLAAAAPAQAATPPAAAMPTVRTGTAHSVTATSEMLTGTINDHGKTDQWQFEYGRTVKYGSGTSVHTLRAGTSTQVVSVLVKHLKPHTLYHFRLVAIAGSGAGATRVPGKDAAFRSGGTGFLRLKATTLTARGGRLSVPLTCDSTITCRGKFSIGTRVRAARTHKLTTVVCVPGASFSIKAHQTHTVSAKLLRGCASVLKAKKRVKAKFTSYPRSGQHALIRTVTLVYKP